VVIAVDEIRVMDVGHTADVPGRSPAVTVTKSGDKIAHRPDPDNEKAPPERAVPVKRMKGLQRSTFCMATRTASGPNGEG